jgi:hypothetical protein
LESRRTAPRRDWPGVQDFPDSFVHVEGAWN